MVNQEGKIIIFSAPSGCGKSTIIGKIRQSKAFPFSFSVSATNRPPRDGEVHGKDYYFLSDDEFRRHLENDNFVEYCEVYPGKFYGTLKSEILERCANGENVVLDVDVEGGINIKKQFGNKALAVFVEPPSVEELKSRLEKRGTDSPEKIKERLARATYELSLKDKYDYIVHNDVLDQAVKDATEIILRFIGNVKES